MFSSKNRKEICIEVDTLHQAIQIITSIIGIFENDVNVYDANEFCRMENDKSGLFSFKVKDTFVGISYGNEIDEYEQTERYSVCYEGKLFDGDKDGYNEHGYDRWEEAIAIYHTYGDMIHIRDNEYDVSFDYGDWN